MKHQLQAGTYCVFPTPAECKIAFERAKEFGILHGMAFYIADEDMLYIDKDGLIYSCLEANYLNPANKPKQTLSKISAAEFISRMEGTWEKISGTIRKTIENAEPIAEDVFSILDLGQTNGKPQLTLPQAISKLQAEGFIFTKGGEFAMKPNSCFGIRHDTSYNDDYPWQVTPEVSLCHTDTRDKFIADANECFDACQRLNNATNG